MLYQEVEEGELNSDEDHLNLTNSEKLSNFKTDNLVESGEISEIDDNNPYVEEDEEIIKLKMKALETLLSKEKPSETSSIKKVKKLKKKSLLNKKKRKEKNENKKKIYDETSMYDNYELKDMDIDYLNINMNTSTSSSNEFSPNNLFDQFNQFSSNFLYQNFNPFLYQSQFSQADWWAQFVQTQLQSQIQPQSQPLLAAPPISNPIQNKRQQFNQNIAKKNFNNKKKFKNMGKKFRPADKVKFSISSNESNKTSPQNNQKSIITINTNKLDVFNSNGIDLDERFLDKTTNSLDVDYRQLMSSGSIENQEDQTDLIKTLIEGLNDKIKEINEQDLNNKENQVDKEEQKEKVDISISSSEEEEAENEEEMLELRKKLLDTVNQKRMLKKQQEEQIDQDITMFKKKLLEHEQDLINTDLKKQSQNLQIQANTSNSNFNILNKKKISPIIIRIDPNEKSDSESSDTGEKQAKTLEHNIGVFLNQAKELINKRENLNYKRKLDGTEDTTPKKSAEIELELKKELEKKDVIKSLRDRINIKTKMISDLSFKSIEWFKFQNKKEKDIELTRQKIKMLREQLQAAEKILTVNEQALEEIKTEKRSIDLKLIKIQNMKKNQQLMLQKVLSSTKLTPFPITTQQSPQVIQAIISTNPTPPPPPPPPPPTPPLAPFSPSESTKEEPKKEEKAPPLPPLPPQPSPTQPASLRSQKETQFMPQFKSVPKPKPFILSKLPTQMTLGGVVNEAHSKEKQTLKTSIPNQSLFTITRPNLYTSKITNTKLEQLASSKFNLINTNTNSNQNQNLNENIVLNAKVVNFSSNNSKQSNKTNNLNQTLKIVDTNKKNELENRQKLNECLENLTHDYPFMYSESYDIWSNESILLYHSSKQASLAISNDILNTCSSDASIIKPSSISINKVLTSSKFLNECQQNNKEQTNSFLKQENNEIFKIEDVENYQSPLNVFRGYRFSSHFSHFNQFEDAYSKLYCNAVDFRRPFCPFDLHGSCKDSNCIYQHSNILTMDNYQRTEHFLSYCPQVLDLSSEYPTQREAIKKLKAYAKSFMNNNLNKMSIKDYFKYLYDHVVENLKIEPSYSTILSRLPILCLNNNKSIGVFDHLELENEADGSGETDLLNNPQLIRLNTNQTGINSFLDTNDQIVNLFDLILSTNLKRSLDSKLKKMLVNAELDLNWFNNLDEGFYSDENIITWVYYAKHVYISSSTNLIEKLLNILSHSLESNPKCEILWLLYLKCYLFKKNSLNDYHEICLLCLDNLTTYDLVWFILNTCPTEFVDMVFERYEKYLLNSTNEDLTFEFEQSDEIDSKLIDRKSYYLLEMILFNVYLKLTNFSPTDTSKKQANDLLYKYLNSSQIMFKLEPNDLSLLWLCLIHLEAFFCLPNWLNLNVLKNKLNKSIETKLFWHLNFKRTFNHDLFKQVNQIYMTRLYKPEESSLTERRFDIFLLPWKQQFKYSCSIEKLQNLFHEALKSINIRCPANSASSLSTKQDIRLFSLPLFVNLINLEISTKRFEVAAKICDRLLKSNDANHLKELWITLINIQRCQQSNLLPETVLRCLKMFPNDSQFVYIASQFYNSIDQKQKSIELIEEHLHNFYELSSDQYETHILFRHLLGLEIPEDIKTKLDLILSYVNKSSKLVLGSSLIQISILFCYYLELKGDEFYTFENITKTFEILIKNTNLINFKTILWIRFFKFISSTNTDSKLVLNLIKNCINDLSQCLKLNLIPFNYLPIRDLTLNSHDLMSNNKLSTSPCGSSILGFYYSFYYDSNVSLGSSFNQENQNYYYHNCIVEHLIKLYAHTQTDKFHLIKHLIDLMPNNYDLVKQFVSFCYKLNGLHKTLQMFYDHLSINAIDDEHLWLLCIKLCLDMNDLQQAILIYHKAELVCSKQKRNLIELKRISTYLFPSVNDSDII